MKTLRGFRSILLNVIQEEPEDSAPAAVPLGVARRRRFSKQFPSRGVTPSPPSISPRRIRSSRSMKEKDGEVMREISRRSSDSSLNTASTGTPAFKVLPPISKDDVVVDDEDDKDEIKMEKTSSVETESSGTELAIEKNESEGEDPISTDNKAEEVRERNERRKFPLGLLRGGGGDGGVGGGGGRGAAVNNELLVCQIAEVLKADKKTGGEVEKMVRLMIEKDEAGAGVLGGEEVRTCLSLAGLNLNSRLVSRLLRATSVGGRRFSIETTAGLLHRAGHLSQAERETESERTEWKVLLDLFTNLSLPGTEESRPQSSQECSVQLRAALLSHQNCRQGFLPASDTVQQSLAHCTVHRSGLRIHPQIIKENCKITAKTVPPPVIK